MLDQPQINIVVPLYNEEEVFNQLIDRITTLMDTSPLTIETVLVDDGSMDRTAELMRSASQRDKRIHSILLSRNFGHQLALSAGLSKVNGTEAILIVDGDLQDPPELLHKFYEKFKEGYDVIYAVRKKRKENIFKKLAYSYFYKLLKKISYIDMPLDSGDFSLVSRRVVDQMNAMPEESRFLRGMRSWIGYKQIGVEYERMERHSGESKYSLKKLIELALNGIFNFSEYPIKLLTRLGILTMSISGLYLFYVLVQRFIYGNVPDGFTALLFVVILFGGVQLLALGVLGEYVLRVFFQVKNRPLFIIKEIISSTVK